MRRGLLYIALLSVLPLLAPQAGAGTEPFVLGRDESAFWYGPYIKQASASGKRCGKGCYPYVIEVTEPGHRLRVALDYPMGNDYFELRLMDPAGKRHEEGSFAFSSREIFVKDPVVGRWRAEVVARSATKTAFRMRAKLEGPPPHYSPSRRLAPNLRLEPPFHFTFRSPATLVAGLLVSGGGNESSSCGYDEIVEENARRCLRMSVGPQNAGVGPLELRFSPVTDAATGEAPMYQIVHYSDGSTRERRAGTYEYHKMHGHYHFTGFAKLELFRVEDRALGRMVPAGAGHKSGFCFGDVMMNSWHSFRQGQAHSSRSSCSDVDEAYMGLTAGWTDIYTAGTPGNYVEFGDNPDGYYVVRATVDDAGMILESNESDNVSYAFIRVKGDEIHLIERGIGTDPWDGDKTVSIDWVERLR